MEKSFYKDGNIISLTLTNFQTFKNTTISFSPTLNFIIGPNGSGKSTISNALSFIFVGNPKTIGKAKLLKEYIRFGEEKCKIEAKVHYNKETVLLTRSMTHTTNSYFINQTSVKKNVYDEFVDKLKININNLCQYLPQERVSEFSRMSPEELLVQTCISLDKNSLIENLNKTKDNEYKLSEFANKENVMSTEKKNIKNFVDNIYKDIEKIKEKESKMLRIEMMEAKKIWLEYENMKADYKRLTNSLKLLKKSLKDNTIESELIRQKIDVIKESPLNIEMISKIKQFERWDGQLKDKIEELKQKKHKEVYLEADIENIEKRKEKNIMEAEKLADEIERDKENLDKEKSSIKEKLRESKLLKITSTLKEGCKKKKIDDAEEVLETVMKHFDNSNDVNIDDYFIPYDTTSLDEQTNRLYDLKRRKNEIYSSSIENKNKFDELEDKKKKINEEGERRLELLKRYHLDTYNAVMWYRANKSLFEKEIIEPTFLHLNITNEKFTAEIEGFLSFTLMTSFICKDSNDFVKFMKKTKDEQKFRINAVEEIKKVDRNEYTSEQYKSFGFEGCILDFINVRKETRDFLITHGHFDSIPLTKSRLDDKKIFEKTNIKRFAMNSKYFEIKRSRYNEKDFIVHTSAIIQKNLFSKKIDTSEIKEQLKLLTVERKKNEIELKAILIDIDDLKDKVNKASEAKNEYDKSLNVIKSKNNLFNMTQSTMKQKKNRLESLKDITDLTLKKKAIEEDIEKIKQDKIDIKNQLIMILRDEEYLKQFQNCMFIYKDIKSEFKTLDFLENNLQLLIKNIKELSTQIESQEAIKDKLKIIMNEKKVKLKDTESTQNNMVSEQIKLLPNTVDELNVEIVREKTQLKFINVNEESKEEYEIKKKQLEQLSTDLVATITTKKTYEEKVKEIKTTLIEDLTNLTDKINIHFQDLFSQLGCEGKLVFVHKNGLDELPCKNWQLNILVKFREKEKLEVLSSFRQSGGEKSVSTILFLLALQKVDSAPFRLVDEINQGMDRHNEKSILSILFKMCMDENSTQFFIISPKLVEELTYNETMKIIILFSDQPGAVKKAFLRGKTCV